MSQLVEVLEKFREDFKKVDRACYQALMKGGNAREAGKLIQEFDDALGAAIAKVKEQGDQISKDDFFTPGDAR